MCLWEARSEEGTVHLTNHSAGYLLASSKTNQNNTQAIAGDLPRLSIVISPIAPTPPTWMTDARKPRPSDMMLAGTPWLDVSRLGLPDKRSGPSIAIRSRRASTYLDPTFLIVR